VPHRIQKIVHQIYLPSPGRKANSKFAVSHVVDQGDVACVLNTSNPAFFLCHGTVGGADKQRLQVQAVFANIVTSNYLLAGMQRQNLEHGWNKVREAFGWFDGEDGGANRNGQAFDHQTDTQPGCKDNFNRVQRIVQTGIIPFGICAGSEKQGGQTETGFAPVQAAANHVTTMTVDGQNIDLINYWSNESLNAGDQLVLKLQWKSTKSYVLNHYYKHISEATFEERNYCWQLVPGVFKMGEKYEVGDELSQYDYRLQGYWRIAQMMHHRNACMSHYEFWANDCSNMRGGGSAQLLQVLFAPTYYNMNIDETGGLLETTGRAQKSCILYRQIAEFKRILMTNVGVSLFLLKLFIQTIEIDECDIALDVEIEKNEKAKKILESFTNHFKKYSPTAGLLHREIASQTTMINNIDAFCELMMGLCKDINYKNKLAMIVQRQKKCKQIFEKTNRNLEAAVAKQKQESTRCYPTIGKITEKIIIDYSVEIKDLIQLKTCLATLENDRISGNVYDWYIMHQNDKKYVYFNELWGLNYTCYDISSSKETDFTGDTAIDKSVDVLKHMSNAEMNKVNVKEATQMIKELLNVYATRFLNVATLVSLKIEPREFEDSEEDNGPLVQKFIENFTGDLSPKTNEAIEIPVDKLLEYFDDAENIISLHDKRIIVKGVKYIILHGHGDTASGKTPDHVRREEKMADEIDMFGLPLATTRTFKEFMNFGVEPAAPVPPAAPVATAAPVPPAAPVSSAALVAPEAPVTLVVSEVAPAPAKKSRVTASRAQAPNAKPNDADK